MRVVIGLGLEARDGSACAAHLRNFYRLGRPRTLKDRHHPAKSLIPIRNLEEIGDLPQLVESLEKRGFHEPEIRKILGENYLRVLRQVL
jgi:microsomal dipeptidase-like Zn-dependent dipeptidase